MHINWKVQWMLTNFPHFQYYEAILPPCKVGICVNDSLARPCNIVLDRRGPDDQSRQQQICYIVLYYNRPHSSGESPWTWALNLALVQWRIWFDWNFNSTFVTIRLNGIINMLVFNMVSHTSPSIKVENPIVNRSRVPDEASFFYVTWLCWTCHGPNRNISANTGQAEGFCEQRWPRHCIY